MWGIPNGRDEFLASDDASLFSSSLPVLRHEKLNFADSEDHGRPVDDSSSNLRKIDLENGMKDPLEGVEPNGLGTLLPDDEDELLAGVMDDFDLRGLPSQLEDLEDYDLFGSGGGMELDFEPQESLRFDISKLNISDGAAGNGIPHYLLANGVGAMAGEHPYGEHPSRTLFVRNINSNVEDSELRSLFEDNPSEKDINQGTLVVFNLDASVSNDDLRQIFGAYGEVKEIRETPHKRHHKFIEFYDVRAAEAALRALNRSDIAGKRIKLEPSRPGGARRNLMQQLSQELEQDEAQGFRHQVGSPVTNSPPGNWVQFGSPVEHNPMHGFSKSPGLGTMNPINGNHLPGLASIIPPHLSNSGKIAPIGKDQGRANHTNQIFSNTVPVQGAPFQHSQSFPEQKLSASPGPISPFVESNSNSSGVGTLSGPQFLWGSPAPYSERTSSSAWPTSPVGLPFSSGGWGQGFPYSRHGSFIGSHHHHHVGSAPSGVSLDRHFGFFPESPDTSFVNPITFAGMGVSCSHGGYVMNFGSHVGGLPGNVTENGSPTVRVMSLPRHGPLLLGNSCYPGPAPSNEGLTERGRSRRVDGSVSQIDSKQYQLDLDKIISGEDTRTTLMIKNIPNKYTSKMLLAAIDENHGGTYDFLYLPIDFKAFNGKKWEKFNSEKVASLAYARIQGKAALVTHFQNSSLMNEDKRCRPILFHSEGQETVDQEPFLSGNLNIFIRQPDGSYAGDSLESLKGNLDEKPEKI